MVIKYGKRFCMDCEVKNLAWRTWKEKPAAGKHFKQERNLDSMSSLSFSNLLMQGYGVKARGAELELWKPWPWMSSPGKTSVRR